MSEPTVEEIVALFERSKHGMLTRADTVLLIADWHKRGEEAEDMRAKCEAIAERYMVEAKDREYRDLVIQAEAIADAIASLKGNGEGK